MTSGLRSVHCSPIHNGKFSCFPNALILEKMLSVISRHTVNQHPVLQMEMSWLQTDPGDLQQVHAHQHHSACAKFALDSNAECKVYHAGRVKDQAGRSMSAWGPVDSCS